MQHVRQADIPTATIVGVITCKEFTARANRHVIDIALTTADDFQIRAIWSHADNSTAAQLQLATGFVRGFDKAIVTNGDIQPAIIAVIDLIGRMIGTTELEVKA